MTTYLELNTELTSTQTQFKEQMHRFAAEVIRPASIALDKLPDPADVVKRGSAFWDAMGKFYQLGYHLMLVPEQYGGSKLAGLDFHIIAEEAGWGGAGLATAMGACGSPFSLAANVAALTGNLDLVDEMVKPFVADNEAGLVGCWAITEPQHGSDSLAVVLESAHDPKCSLDLVGRRDGDDWILDGQKSSWVSNGTIATHGTVHFAVDKSKGAVCSAIATMPLDLPGISKGKPLNKLGQRDLNQGEIFFDGVRVPRKYVVVEPELYAMVVDLQLTGGNASMAAMFTGVARSAFEEAMTYCRQRVQGGKPLCEHQLIQRKLFDMFIKVESSRQLSRAVALYNTQSGTPSCRYAIAGKVYCTQAAFEVASDALQLFGGYGLSKEFVIEKIFRDARASLVEDGCNDTLALVGARQMIDSYI